MCETEKTDKCLWKTSLSYATTGATVISSGLKIGWLPRQIIFEYSVNNSQVEQNPAVPQTVTQYTVLDRLSLTTEFID